MKWLQNKKSKSKNVYFSIQLQKRKKITPHVLSISIIIPVRSSKYRDSCFFIQNFKRRFKILRTRKKEKKSSSTNTFHLNMKFYICIFCDCVGYHLGVIYFYDWFANKSKSRKIIRFMVIYYRWRGEFWWQFFFWRRYQVKRAVLSGSERRKRILVRLIFLFIWLAFVIVSLKSKHADKYI